MSGARRGFSGCLPVLLLLVIVLILFSRLLREGSVFYAGDFLAYFSPLKNFIRDHLLAYGSLPFWNPYQFSGTPLVSNLQASMFYPPGVLYYLLPAESAYFYSTIVHCLLGSLFMFAFMRTMAVSSAGSFAAALIFSINGYFVGHLYAGHLTFVQTYIWLPLIFLFLNRFAQTGRIANALIAGLLLGVHILGGFPQVAFYTLLASTLFLLYHFIIRLRHGPNGIWKLSWGFLVFVLAGFCIAAVQILPTLEFSRLSTRGGGIGYAMATYDSLHPKELLSFLIPDIFGNPVDGTYWRSHEFHHFWETCGYVGILPLLLLFVKKQKADSNHTLFFFSFLALFALFLALGKYNPLYPLIYKIPGFSTFRIPAQIIYLYVFSVAVLSGIGLGGLAEGKGFLGKGFLFFLLPTFGIALAAAAGFHLFPSRYFSYLFTTFAEGPVSQADLTLLFVRMGRSIDKAALLFALSFFVLYLGNRFKVRPSFLALAACTVISVDLLLFGSQFLKKFDPVEPSKKIEIIGRLTKNAAEGRVLTEDPLFNTNDGLRYRFPSVLGYDPLILKRYVEWVQAVQNLPADEHVVNLDRYGDPTSKISGLLHIGQRVADGKISRVESSMPYAFLVDGAITRNRDEVLPFMKSNEFDPQKTVVFEKESFPSSNGNIPSSESLTGSCQVVSYDDEEIKLKTASNRAAYLVLSEMFYPGWYAAVDGRQTPVLRGNYLFRVIPLDGGEHEVRFHFISWPFRFGAILSSLSFCVILGFVIRLRKSRRRNRM